jgi:hypothetical protein
MPEFRLAACGSADVVKAATIAAAIVARATQFRVGYGKVARRLGIFATPQKALVLLFPYPPRWEIND